MVQKAGLRILNSFSSTNKAMFAELCKNAGYPTDLGGYYLRQLLNSGYLAKGLRGEYRLTTKGRHYVTTAHIKSDAITPRVHVLLVPTIGEDVVLLERLKQPFLHVKEWPATAIYAGESANQAVDRLLAERLAAASNVGLEGVFRRIDYYEAELFDDKIFLVYTVQLAAEPKNDVVNGRNLRLPHLALNDQVNKSRSLMDIYEFTKQATTFTERKYELIYANFEPREVIQ